MTSPNSPGRDGHPDGRAMENRLRIWTEYQGPCVVVGVAGEIDIATADRLRLQVIIAVLAAISPSLDVDLGGGVLRLIRAGRAGGDLESDPRGRREPRVAHPQDRLRALLARTRLDTRITVRDNLRDAITAAG